MSKKHQVRTVLVIEDEANISDFASAAASQCEKALSMGAADYLVKPVSASRLRKAVANVPLRRSGVTP